MRYERLQQITPHLQAAAHALDEIYNILATMVEENEIEPPEDETPKINTEERNNII